MYEAHQGDIILLNFDPQSGHEQKGTQPALVVSNHSFTRYTRLGIVCPITSTRRGFPLHVVLDARTRTQGEILCEQVKSLDLAARQARLLETLPEDLLRDVLDRIGLSLQPE